MPTLQTDEPIGIEAKLPFRERPETIATLQALGELSQNGEPVASPSLAIQSLTGISYRRVVRILGHASASRVPLVAAVAIPRPASKSQRHLAGYSLVPAGERLVESAEDPSAAATKVAGLERYRGLLSCLGSCLLPRLATPGGAVNSRWFTQCQETSGYQTTLHQRLCGELEAGGYLNFLGYGEDGDHFYTLTKRGQELAGVFSQTQPTTHPGTCQMDVTHDPGPVRPRGHRSQKARSRNNTFIETYLDGIFAAQWRSGEPEEVVSQEVVSATGLGQKSVRNHLERLCEEGLLARISDSGGRFWRGHVYAPIHRQRLSPDQVPEHLKDWAAKLHQSKPEQIKMAAAVHACILEGIASLENIKRQPGDRPWLSAVIDQANGNYLTPGPALAKMPDAERRALLRHFGLEQLVYGRVMSEADLGSLLKLDQGQTVETYSVGLAADILSY